jgi:guanylate kinase
VVGLLTRSRPDLFPSESATTRSARPGEVDAGAYRFLSEAEFDRLVADDAFLEWARVFGNRYGTPAAPIEEARAAGRDAILEIDVQGARTIRAQAPDAVLIFLVPPSEAELQRRLMSRGTEEDNEMARRLTAAADEMTNAEWFDHVVVNDDLQRAADEVAAIIETYRR